MKTIRELWNEQADELNQFDVLEKDEVEEFANKIIALICAGRNMDDTDKCES
jgi:hypothetical protein